MANVKARQDHKAQAANRLQGRGLQSLATSSLPSHSKNGRESNFWTTEWQHPEVLLQRYWSSKTADFSRISTANSTTSELIFSQKSRNILRFHRTGITNTKTATSRKSSFQSFSTRYKLLPHLRPAVDLTAILNRQKLCHTEMPFVQVCTSFIIQVPVAHLHVAGRVHLPDAVVKFPSHSKQWGEQQGPR